MAPRTGARLAKLALIWIFLLAAPYWAPLIGGYTALCTRVVILGMAAMSFNMLLGFTGVMSFGHAAFFGLGAYGAGFALKYATSSTSLAVVAGMLLGGVAGALLGALVVRRRGVYFAMVTIAFGQIFYFIAFRWNAVTGGDDGLRGFSRQPFGIGHWLIDIEHDPTLFYYFVLATFVVITALMGLILESPFGHTLVAIRENERRARFLGIPVDLHIWMVFVISCAFVACAGALYACLNNFADPTLFNYNMSGTIVIMAVLGGFRMFWGPLLGAVVFVVMQDYLSSVTQNWMWVVGLMFVAVVLFFPRGILGIIQRRGGMTLLNIRSLRKQFGSLVAVDNVSMQVASGELRAIIGPNGAGKTTFFNMISGYFRPSAGEIELDGTPITQLTVQARVARGMARTFQITEVFPELTVRENLRIAVEVQQGLSRRLWIGGTTRAHVREAVETGLEMAGLTGKGDRLVGELSHGDQRAAEIATALALQPRLLLLDEPTAGMGEQETYQVATLIRRLHRVGALTIVLIEHDMRVVFNLADRITVLDQGRMLADGTPQEIADNPAVQAAYLGSAA